MTLSLFDSHLYTCTNIKQIRSNQSHHFISLTYVEKDKSIFICCHDSKEIIRQYSILSKWNLIKTWSKENLINRDDVGKVLINHIFILATGFFFFFVGIRCIRVNSSETQFGLIIKNKNDQFRIAFYSMDLLHIYNTIPIIPVLSLVKDGRTIDFMLYLSPFIDDRRWLIVYGNGIHEHSLLLVDSQTEKIETIINDSILNTCMLDEQYLIVRMKQSMLIYDIE